MQQKYRIAVLGIGGVGGFIGGKLAAAFSPSADKEVIFIARGAHAQAIRERGLQLITDEGEMLVRPDQVVEDPAALGPVDLLLCCTKAYDLENSLKALAASVTADTLILPLLNGVDHSEQVKAIFPAAKVLEGCIYVVSKITAPGAVQQKGAFYALHFGGDTALAAEMNDLLALLQQANIHALIEADIRSRLWSKFAFISPLATYTSAHNISVGKILESEEHKAAIRDLMNELVALAGSLDIQLAAGTADNNFGVMEKLPYEATSSMQADFAAHKATELETLTGFVVRKAAGQGMPLAAYDRMYQLLRARQ
jgi:2-dehydropantoate 2-reductase